MEGPKRDQVLKLIEEKGKLENDLREQHEILKTNQIGMTEPLVDDQGFPREDIDVYQGIADIHSEDATVDPIAFRPAIISSDYSNVDHADSVPLKPFIVVNTVDSGSPADIAVSNIVSHSVGQPINVQLMRGKLVIGVTLVPKPWSDRGRGLLGCHIQKVELN
ncbi:Proteasome 26S non-ATPase subunit 9 [Operophtera brumata]|uniref:Proteasome 26S non-ATPase subunit 9 n=1 Tax=Operophtera brumata TaxID=104452 RepID=A0A0L7LVI5_OPEBR|nr:Proteasome 26S non-ATPase subunit 9 [Operophtera brumata]